MPLSIPSDVLGLREMLKERHTIPVLWYQYLRYKTGKPDVNAIIILGALASEYQQQGGGLLQTSYQYYVYLFNLSKDQVRGAFKRLESYGLVRRTFRTAEIKIEEMSAMMSNVMFVDLNFEKVEELSKECQLEQRAY